VIQAADPSITAYYIQESAHFIFNKVEHHNFKTLIRVALMNSKISVMSTYTCSLLAVTLADVCVAHIVDVNVLNLNTISKATKIVLIYKNTEILVGILKDVCFI
jgi:hypothetical protein